MKLSVIVPSLTGSVPKSLRRQVAGREDVELVVVTGVSPVGRARNEGLRRATGDYVAWMDADDEVTEEWLESILGELECAETSAGRLDGLMFDAEAVGWRKAAFYVFREKQGVFAGTELAREIYRDERLKSHLWRWVLRRELWEGESFDEEVVALEDYLVLPKVVAKANEIGYLPKKTYRYLHQENSAINRRNEARDAQSVRIAIRRHQEAAAVYRQAALWGAATMIYWSLDKAAIDRRTIGQDYRSALLDGRKFLARHLWGLWRESGHAVDSFGDRLHWMARFGTAVCGWWGLQQWRRRLVVSD